MARFFLARMASAVLVLWGVSVLSFGVAFALPGDPAAVIAGPQATPETIQAIRHELQLDRPLPAQYLGFMGRLLRGDLGRSYTGQPVVQAIGQRLPATVALALTAWGLWLLGGTLIGTAAA